MGHQAIPREQPYVNPTNHIVATCTVNGVDVGLVSPRISLRPSLPLGFQIRTSALKEVVAGSNRGSRDGVINPTVLQSSPPVYYGTFGRFAIPPFARNFEVYVSSIVDSDQTVQGHFRVTRRGFVTEISCDSQ